MSDMLHVLIHRLIEASELPMDATLSGVSAVHAVQHKDSHVVLSTLGVTIGQSYQVKLALAVVFGVVADFAPSFTTDTWRLVMHTPQPCSGQCVGPCGST